MVKTEKGTVWYYDQVKEMLDGPVNELKLSERFALTRYAWMDSINSGIGYEFLVIHKPVDDEPPMDQWFADIMENDATKLAVYAVEEEFEEFVAGESGLDGIISFWTRVGKDIEAGTIVQHE